MAGFQKGDVIAIVETRVITFAFGSGRPSETYQSIQLVRVESASRDGATIKSSRKHPASPVYKYDNRYNRYKLLAISDAAMQRAARSLFDSAITYLEYQTQEEAKAAIVAAL